MCIRNVRKYFIILGLREDRKRVLKYYFVSSRENKFSSFSSSSGVSLPAKNVISQTSATSDEEEIEFHFHSIFIISITCRCCSWQALGCFIHSDFSILIFYSSSTLVLSQKYTIFFLLLWLLIRSAHIWKLLSATSLSSFFKSFSIHVLNIHFLILPGVVQHPILLVIWELFYSQRWISNCQNNLYFFNIISLPTLNTWILKHGTS